MIKISLKYTQSMYQVQFLLKLLDFLQKIPEERAFFGASIAMYYFIYFYVKTEITRVSKFMCMSGHWYFYFIKILIFSLFLLNFVHAPRQ